jgi:hypothetical protein
MITGRTELLKALGVSRSNLGLGIALGVSVQENLVMSAMGILGSGGAPAVALPQLAHIAFDLDADTLTGAENSGVASCTESINGLVFAQATGAKQPLQINNVLGSGHKAMLFNGTSSSLVATGTGSVLDSVLQSRKHTTILVCAPVSNKTNGCVINWDGYVLRADGAALGIYANAAPTASRGFNVIGVSSCPAASSLTTLDTQREFLNGTIYKQGSSLTTGTTADFTIGGISASSLYSNIYVMRAITWDVELTPLEIIQATKYLYLRYGQPLPWATSTYFPFLDGNSLVACHGITNIADKVAYKVAAALGLTWGQWTTIAQVGATTAKLGSSQVLNGWTGIGAELSLPMKVFFLEYYNSRLVAPATLQAQMNAYCAAVRAIPNCKLALGTSLSSANDPETNRNTFDAYYDANFSAHCDAYVPEHLNTFIGLEGPDSVDGNSYYNNSATYYADIAHLNSAGASIFAPDIVAGFNAIA